MIDQFRTVYRGGTGEIVEKKSRFIATVRLVESEEEALSCLEALRKKYWDVPSTSIKRRASAPYWAMTSSGSMPLPRLLDILRSRHL